jgi:hypothetical protein
MRYTGYSLQPAMNAEDAETMAVALAPSISLRAGTVMAQITASPGVYTAYNQPALAAPSSAPTVSDSATAGTWPASALQVGYTYLANGGETTISPLASFTPVGAKLLHIAAITPPAGASGVNIYAGATSTSMVLIGTSVGGVAADYSVPAQPSPINPTPLATPPVTNTAFVRAPLAAPATGPSVSPGATGSPGWAVTPLMVGITYLSAGGETTPAWTTYTPATAGYKLHVAAIGLPTGAIGLNVYAGLTEAEAQLIGTSTTGAAADYDVPTVEGKTPPTINTATAGDGTDVAKGLLMYDCTTDTNGNITHSYEAGQSSFIPGATGLVTPIFWRGIFRTTDLIGLDANAVSQLGRLVSGTITAGLLEVL